jgi:hypothetical protein
MLLVPATYKYEAINALYLQVNPETASAFIVPIHITINSNNQLQSKSFYAQWEKWQAHYRKYQLTTAFVWIVENEHSLRVVQEKTTQETRASSVVISPEFTEIFITIKDLCPPNPRGSCLETLSPEGCSATKRPHGMLGGDEVAEAGPSTRRETLVAIRWVLDILKLATRGQLKYRRGPKFKNHQRGQVPPQ